MKYEKLIRAMPKVLVVAALFDLIKQVLFTLSFWQENRYFDALGQSNDVYWKIVYILFDRALGAVLFPLGWLASAVSVTLLLALYDRERPDNA